MIRGKIKDGLYPKIWVEVDGNRNSKEFHANDEEPAIGTHLMQGSSVMLNFVKNTLNIEDLTKTKHKKR